MATDLVVVANNVDEMIQSHGKLIEWCEQKVSETQAELEDLEHIKIDLMNASVSTTKIKARIKAATFRLVYYNKMGHTISQGWPMVPMMRGTTLALRVEEDVEVDRFLGADCLPHGNGKFMNPNAITRKESYLDNDGNPQRREVVVRNNDKLDLPIEFARIGVIDKLKKALDQKTFDEIMVVSGDTDPMVMGVIYEKPSYQGKRCAFLISWFISTKDL